MSDSVESIWFRLFVIPEMSEPTSSIVLLTSLSEVIFTESPVVVSLPVRTFEFSISAAASIIITTAATAAQIIFLSAIHFTRVLQVLLLLVCFLLFPVFLPLPLPRLLR